MNHLYEELNLIAKNYPHWMLGSILLCLGCVVVCVGLMIYGVATNREVHLWPPRILPAPTDHTQPDNNTAGIDEYKAFLNYLPGINDTAIAILDELGNHNGTMKRYALESAMEDRGLTAGLGGTLTGMSGGLIIEGDRDIDVTLTDFGNQLVRIVRTIQEAETPANQ